MRHLINIGQAGVDAGIDANAVFDTFASLDPRELAKLFASSPGGLEHLRNLAHLTSATLAEAERLTGPGDQQRGAEILGRRT